MMGLSARVLPLVASQRLLEGFAAWRARLGFVPEFVDQGFRYALRPLAAGDVSEQLGVSGAVEKRAEAHVVLVVRCHVQLTPCVIPVEISSLGSSEGRRPGFEAWLGAFGGARGARGLASPAQIAPVCPYLAHR